MGPVLEHFYSPKDTFFVVRGVSTTCFNAASDQLTSQYQQNTTICTVFMTKNGNFEGFNQILMRVKNNEVIEKQAHALLLE
jgi:hypothetical protein